MPPDVGKAEQSSARQAAVLSVAMLTSTQPHTMTTGPPYVRPCSEKDSAHTTTRVILA